VDAGDQPAALLAALRQRTAARIVLTLGADGALVDDGAGSVSVPALPPAAVVDTTGAGDAFSAALAVALAEGRGLVSAARFASAAGHHAVTLDGVIDALPDRATVEALLAGENGSRD
jgi:ribokinase